MSGNIMSELREGDARKIFFDKIAKAFKCSYCALVVVSPTVESHLANHTREVTGQFTCTYCCYASNTRVHEGHHRKYLEKPHKFRCEECRFSGDSQIALDSHLSLKLHTEHQFGELSGKEVKRKKCTPLTMENSGRGWKKFVFKVKKVYRCAFCGMAPSPLPGNLALHIQRHQMKSGEYSTCKYCSFSWSGVSSHQGHHTRFLQKEHKFRCNSCNFAGDTRSAMKTHLLLGLHKGNGGESSMNCQQGQGIKQEGKINSSTFGTVKHGNTPGISGDVVQFRRVKDLCMVVIHRNRNYLCLLCGMGVNFMPSFMKEHDRRHHIMADADNLNKCDYCSYVCSNATHNNHHRRFLMKHHKFVCDLCNFVCEYKNVLNLHHEVAHHEDNSNDMNDSRNLKETSESGHDEVALSPPEDMEVCSDTTNTAGPSSENVISDFPGPSTSNHVTLVSRGVKKSHEQGSIPKSIKTEEEDNEDDGINVISGIAPRRRVPVKRQIQTDIFRCPFCPFLVNDGHVMMTHLHSHSEYTSGQAAPQQSAQPLSVQFPVGATAQPQVHPPPFLQPSQFVPQHRASWQRQSSGGVPQQTAYWQPQASAGTSQQILHWQPQASGGVPQQTACWQPQASAGASQQMMNQVAYTYPQGLISTQFQNRV